MIDAKLIFLSLFFVIYLALGSSAQSISEVKSNDLAETKLNSRRMEMGKELMLYPNPAVENIFVNIKNQDLKHVVFELHTLLGNRVRIKPVEIAPNTFRIAVKNLPSGYYYLVVKDEVIRFEKGYKILKN